MAMARNDEPQQDAVTFLIEEHAAVERMFVEYERSQGVARKDAIAEGIVRDLRLHAAMEEQSFYPSIREILADGEQLVREAVEEHQQAKEELAQLEAMSTDDPGFDARMHKLISDVRHHVNEEEGEMLPKLRQAVGQTWLVELGEELRRTKERLAGEGVQKATFEARPAPPVLTSAGPPSMRRSRSRSAPKKATAKRPAATKATAKRASSRKSSARSTETKAAAKRAGGGRVVYHVKPSSDGGWQVAKRGAARASSNHERKTEAVARGKELAAKQRLGQLVVHKADGTIQGEFTYGADPRRTRG
jgi:hemerythrin-like domain-containing protein